MKYTFAIIFLLASITTTVWAKQDSPMTSTPISLGIVPPVQFPNKKFDVTGIRLTAGYGINRTVTGIDLGLIGNHTSQNFKGVGISGLFNYNSGNFTGIGLQLAGLANVNKEDGKMYGLQAAIVSNYSPYTDVYGIQLGLYNRAQSVTGIQIGIVNVTQNLRGLQIGLANFNAGGPFGVSPLINFGF